MTITTAAPVRPDVGRRWADDPVPTSRNRWITRAREVAQLAAQTAFERDTAAAPPYAEVQWIKDAGLLGLLGPRSAGGGDADWATVLDVVREFAEVDGSLANIVAWHYAYFWFLRALGTPAQREQWEYEVTTQRLLLAGIVNLRDKPVGALDEGDTLLLNGFKSFNTGVPVADRAFVGVAIDGTDDLFFLLVDVHQPGIVPGDDWDTLGQRSTGSGSVTITDVRVPWTDAIGFAGREFVPQPGNATPGITAQSLMSALYLGLARGALDRAATYIRSSTRAWLHSPYERAVDDPTIVEAFGGLQSRLLAAEALLREATERASVFLADTDAVTEASRGDLAALLSATKAVATEVGIEVTTKLFELTGARSTARRCEIDRFWRDLRTHTLHDPVAQKRLQVGAYVLRDEYPLAVDFYS